MAFDQVRQDLEEHAAHCPEPSAYFILTYDQSGRFQVTAVADQDDYLAVEICNVLIEALRDDPKTEAVVDLQPMSVTARLLN
jgi:hypothetical protein